MTLNLFQVLSPWEDYLESDHNPNSSLNMRSELVHNVNLGEVKKLGNTRTIYHTSVDW